MSIPVILSGGAGARLWPLLRELYPKQFSPLAGERSLLGGFEAFVLASRPEESGLTMAEARVARRPVMASAVDGLPASPRNEGPQEPEHQAASTAAIRQPYGDRELRQAVGAAR